MKRILTHFKDQRGVESLEWVAVGAGIVALIALVYPGTLATGINSVITTIVTKLNAF